MGLVGVLSPEEVVDRKDCESFRTDEEGEEITPVLSLSAILETWKTWSLDDGAFGRRVRGTIGRLIGFGFGGTRRVRLDSPVRHCKNLVTRTKHTH